MTLQDLTGWNKGQMDSFKKMIMNVIRTGKPKINIEEPPINDR